MIEEATEDNKKTYIVATFSRQKVSDVFKLDAIDNGQISEMHGFTVTEITMGKDEDDDVTFIVQAEVLNPYYH